MMFPFSPPFRTGASDGALTVGFGTVHVARQGDVASQEACPRRRSNERERVRMAAKEGVSNTVSRGFAMVRAQALTVAASAASRAGHFAAVRARLRPIAVSPIAMSPEMSLIPVVARPVATLWSTEKLESEAARRVP
jgi:hypothetical protein